MEEVLGSRTELTFDDLGKLKYINAVFKESLRLYPPAPEVTRLAVQEMNVDGIRVPKNTTLMVFKISYILIIYYTYIYIYIFIYFNLSFPRLRAVV